MKEGRKEVSSAGFKRFKQTVVLEDITGARGDLIRYLASRYGETVSGKEMRVNEIGHNRNVIYSSRDVLTGTGFRISAVEGLNEFILDEERKAGEWFVPINRLNQIEGYHPDLERLLTKCFEVRVKDGEDYKLQPRLNLHERGFGMVVVGNYPEAVSIEKIEEKYWQLLDYPVDFSEQGLTLFLRKIYQNSQVGDLVVYSLKGDSKSKLLVFEKKREEELWFIPNIWADDVKNTPEELRGLISWVHQVKDIGKYSLNGRIHYHLLKILRVLAEKYPEGEDRVTLIREVKDKMSVGRDEREFFKTEVGALNKAMKGYKEEQFKVRFRQLGWYSLERK